MKKPLHSFHLRVTLGMVASMVVLSIINNILDYHLTFKSHFENERVSLENLAKNAALMINAEELKQIPLDKNGIDAPAYQIISQQLKRIKATNPQIEDIYILTPTGTKNIWKFIVDLDETKPNGTKIPASAPGTDYDAGRFSQMISGLNEPSADDKLETDEYGTTLSGYAPIRDEVGKPLAILGIDIDAANIHAMKKEILKGSVIFLMIAIVLAIILGALISGRVVQPIKQLKRGVDYIKDGHWSHKVNISGKDEIAQLASSFNKMAEGLAHSQQLLRSYFFDSVKSMAMLLEAKDRYTSGHSQSTADYSEKIALRMGVDPTVVKYFKSIVLLHDIGKVGVKDTLLQKPGKLDEKEFELMKQHPLLGEQILMPILEDPLMRSVIRNHHERHDGQGYPDGLSEDKIPLLVSIVTVADSYDAMTSNRSYRQAMSKEAAIEQLVKNKGTQFNPKVVDIFLEILKEEGR